MIRAIVFDFGQTLVDSADGFRTAEKETQRKVRDALGLTDEEAFLSVYREIRSRFHACSDFSRKRILAELFRHYGRRPDIALLERWETAGNWGSLRPNPFMWGMTGGSTSAVRKPRG